MATLYHHSPSQNNGNNAKNKRPNSAEKRIHTRQFTKRGDYVATAKKLPSGSWRVRAYVGKDSDGKAIYKSFTAPTKKDAELLALAYKGETESSAMSVVGALNAYTALKSGVLSPSTVVGYKRMARNCFEKIGNIALDALTAEDIQRWISSMAQDKSPKTVSNAWGLLSSAIKMYRPDFAPHVTLPQKRKQKIAIPEQDEIRRMRAALVGTDLELPFLLATQCGLRASEIAALSPADFDLDELTVTIDKALVMGEFGAEMKAPKSYAGYRTLPCSAEIAGMVSALEGGKVWRNSPAVLSSAWSKFVRAEGFYPYNFHALRHYFASRAALAGIPKEYLVELMGHSSSKILDQVYLHTFQSAKKVFADKLREI